MITSLATPGLGRILKSELLRKLQRRHSDVWPTPEPLEQAESYEVLPALYEKEQFDRVVRVGFDRSLESEQEKLDARVAFSTPPEVTVFRDVICCGRRLFGRSGNHFLANGNPIRQAFMSQRSGYDHVVVTNSTLGLKYFGHWLGDDCAARELPLPSSGVLKSFARPNWSDAAFYEDAFGQVWDEEPVFYADKLSVFTDIGFGMSKKRRLEDLRARMRKKYPIAENEGGIAYVQRGSRGEKRSMANEDELMTRLSAAGITIVTGESGGETIARAMMDCKIIIGVEGSQINHATYNLHENGALLVLQPPHRFYNPHHEWARLMGMRYGTVVGQPRTQDYIVDPDEVLAMVDRLQRAIDRPDAA